MRIDLNGIWQATELLGEQARASRPGYVPAGWRDAPVPGYFSEVSGLEGNPDRLLYRRTFRLEVPPSPSTAARLWLQSVCSGARVWCNGAFVGEHDGPFVPHSFELSRYLTGGENVLLVEIAGPRPMVGIPGAVELELLAAPAPEHLQLYAVPQRLQGKKAEYATVDFDLSLTAPAGAECEWSARATPQTFAGEPVACAGAARLHRGWNRLRGRLQIAAPRLWWTWDQGEPDLYRFELELRTPGGVQRVERPFGIRTAELRNWTFFLNGSRLFLRGAAYGPADLLRAAGLESRAREDVARMREANLNAVWVREHVAPPALYEEASRKGILIWQEVPAGITAADVPDLVDRLGAEPSLGVWQLAPKPAPETGLVGRLAGAVGRNRRFAEIAEALESADDRRSRVGRLDEPGIFRADYDVRKPPEKVRFVIELGSQAFPSPEHSRRFIKGQWPDLNFTGLGATGLEQAVPVSLAQSFEQYAAASQAHQSYQAVRLIEHFRLREHRPCGGILLARFTDGEPAVSPALLDYWREPKAAFGAVAQAFRPLIALAAWPQYAYAPGKDVELNVTLINDLAAGFAGEWSWAIVRDDETLAGATTPVALEPNSLVTLEAAVRWKVDERQRPGGAELVLTLTPRGCEPVITRYGFDIL